MVHRVLYLFVSCIFLMFLHLFLGSSCIAYSQREKDKVQEKIDKYMSEKSQLFNLCEICYWRVYLISSSFKRQPVFFLLILQITVILIPGRTRKKTEPIGWQKCRSGSQMEPVISKGLGQEFANIKVIYSSTSHWDRMLLSFRQRLRQYWNVWLVALSKRLVKEQITISPDSQAAVEALTSSGTKSLLAGGNIEKLTVLSEVYQVTIMWVPGHGIQQNETADRASEKGTGMGMQFFGASWLYYLERSR